MPLAGAFKLRREERPALDGLRVAAVPVPVPVVVEGEVLVGVTAVLESLMEVEDLYHCLRFSQGRNAQKREAHVTWAEERLADEEVADEAEEDPLPVLLVVPPIENEPVVA